MPSQYNLRIKATLDTSQVRQELQSLRLPGNGGGGGGGGGSGGGAGGGASAEIEKAAKTVNLRAISAGFRLFSRELENLSAAMGGNGLVSKIGDFAHATTEAITAFRAFGAAGAIAVTALNAFTSILQNFAQNRQVAKNLGTALGVESKEITSTTDKEDARHLASGDLGELQRARQTLLDQIAEQETKVSYLKYLGEYAVQEQNALSGNIATAAGESLWGAVTGNKTSREKSEQATADISAAKDALAGMKRRLEALDNAIAEVTSATEKNARAEQEAADAAARLSQERQATLTQQTADIIANRKGELALRADVENQDVDALQSRLQEVTRNIETLENMGPLSEGLQRFLQQSYSMQDNLTSVLNDKAASHASAIEYQNRYFGNLAFNKQLGVYAEQAGSLTDKQRESMERRRAQLEKENAELRKRAEAGEEIDLTKFQENARRIDSIAGVLDQDATMKSQGKDLPDWLDGVEERTDDWFHSIGGSIGGEGNIQNDEYRVLQEIERLVREQTSYAKQTATAVI